MYTQDPGYSVSLIFSCSSKPQVFWSPSGELVTLACEDTFYVLRYSRENYLEALQAGQVDDDGVESAFEVITDINER